MITVLKPTATAEQRQHLITWLKGQGLEVHISEGSEYTVLGLVGDTAHIDMDLLASLEIVRSVKRVSEPFKKCNRKFHPEDSVVPVGNTSVGGGSFTVIAGPCSVESREQTLSIAESVKQSGASILRGAAYNPRISPYDFQGLQSDGLRILIDAKKATGLPIVTELIDMKDLDAFEDVDIIQVGARNMQNFEMLKGLGRTSKTILLQRGLANTVKELLMSAEYIMAGGNENIIFCERGIRTFETYTQYTLDLSAVPVLRELTHLPVIVDPSHATGHAQYVPSMALAAAASGADGLMLQVHSDPIHALCGGAQSLTPAQFDELMNQIRRVLEAIRT